MIQKGFKYRIYPTKTQRVFLEQHFGATRFLYNWGLNTKIKHYETTKKSISWVDLNNKLPNLKKEYIWLNNIGSQSLQMEMRNLDTAFKNFFRSKKGFPKFKSKKDNNKSFQIPSNSGNAYCIENNKLYIPKLKTGIKIVQHRFYNGKEMNLTISKNPAGQYFASILVETNENIVKPKRVKEETTIGIDLGIKDFLVDSNGNKINNPKYLRKSEKKLIKCQRKLAKKDKESNNKHKQRIKTARVYNKIKNQRKDFLHKLSSRIISENQTICIEDLAVKNMVKNHKLAKSIGDASWSEFTRQLNYKAIWYGKNIITIGQFEPSSKMCSSCGSINNELTLKDREWTCKICGVEYDRDVNAAKNIKNFGLVKSDYPLLKLNTAGTAEINACQTRVAELRRSGQEDSAL